MGKCPRIYKPRGRGKVVDVGTCRAQKARHRTSSPETRPSPPPHSPLRPLKRRHRRRIIQSHIFIGGGYGGLHIESPWRFRSILHAKSPLHFGDCPVAEPAE